MRVPLGPVSHFNIAVEDPGASAAWWLSNFDLDEWGRSDSGILLGNDAIMIGFVKGSPVPGVLDHLGFRTSDIRALEAARDALRANGVDLEDPGDEIGPVAPVPRAWAYGFTILTVIVGNSTSKDQTADRLRLVALAT